MNAITPPTPERVADLLAGGDNDYHDGNDWWPSISTTGNVVDIAITPVGEDYETKLPKVHFQAHVFQVTPAPPVAAEGVELAADIARELAYTSVGKAYEGWTVVEREDIDTTRWKSHHWLVIRNEQGQHYGANYSKGLTEYQDTRPWEGDTIACFEAVSRQTTVVQSHSWVTRTALINLHDWDELIFGGFYCTHCTPDDTDDPDDNVMWPCPSLRAAGVTDEEAIKLIAARRAAVTEKSRRDAQGEAGAR